MNIRTVVSSAIILTGLLGALNGCGGGNSGDTNIATADTAGNGDGMNGAGVGTEATANDGASPGGAAPACGALGTEIPSLSAATLILQIGGTDAGVSYDLLEVSGRARVGGTLQLVFEESFEPSKGQQFTVVKASCLTGSFAKVMANKGAILKVTQDTTSLTVTVQ